jgi:hypothetical protein
MSSNRRADFERRSNGAKRDGTSRIERDFHTLRPTRVLATPHFPRKSTGVLYRKAEGASIVYIEIIISRIRVLVDSGCRIVTTEELSKYFI